MANNNGNIHFEDNSRQATNRLTEIEEQILLAWGEVLVDATVLLTPVDSGTLRDSIEYEVNENKKEVKYGSTLTDEDYPVFIELGTSKMEAQPYIEPALDNNRNRLIEYARTLLSRGMGD